MDEHVVYWLERPDRDAGRITTAQFLKSIETGSQRIAFAGRPCQTHSPYRARGASFVDGRLIVNPGSVGSPGYSDVNPFPHVIEAGTPDARYAILELMAALVRDLPSHRAL